MSKTVDYYYSLVSPWTYLGGPRFESIVAAAGARVNYKPVSASAAGMRIMARLMMSAAEP